MVKLIITTTLPGEMNMIYAELFNMFETNRGHGNGSLCPLPMVLPFGLVGEAMQHSHPWVMLFPRCNLPVGDRCKPFFF